ncbi:MAG: Gfo/Idh/MocA family oxidoreductase [Defluviicoccus sp.]|nr:Gfo/Idh/MocA family oxidoreductase [Defluviicoccus sp.]
MIRAAVVGLGRWGQTLVDSLGEGSDAIRFVRAVTRTPSKVEDYAAAKGMALGADYDEALSDPDIDAVVLATPHSLHREQIVAAAEAGKHVFCEKPLTLSADDAESAIEATDKAGVTLAIGHNRRFAPNFRAMQGILDGGRLGEILHVEGNFSADLTRAAETWRADAAESPAGGMTSLGIHVVDAFIALAGRMTSVRASSKRIALPFGVDDATSVLIDFENGCTGYLGTVAATAHLYQVRVFGTEGWAQIHALDRLEADFRDGSRDERRWDGYDYPGYRTIRECLEAFATAAAGGAPFPVPPGEMGHAVGVLEAIVRSAETGEAQPV